MLIFVGNHKNIEIFLCEMEAIIVVGILYKTVFNINVIIVYGFVGKLAVKLCVQFEIIHRQLMVGVVGAFAHRFGGISPALHVLV